MKHLLDLTAWRRALKAAELAAACVELTVAQADKATGKALSDKQDAVKAARKARDEQQ